MSFVLLVKSFYQTALNSFFEWKFVLVPLTTRIYFFFVCVFVYVQFVTVYLRFRSWSRFWMITRSIKEASYALFKVFQLWIFEISFCNWLNADYTGIIQGVHKKCRDLFKTFFCNIFLPFCAMRKKFYVFLPFFVRFVFFIPFYIVFKIF